MAVATSARLRQDDFFAVPCDTTSVVALTVGGQAFTINPKDVAFQPLSGAGTDGLCLSGISSGQIGGPNEWLVGDVFLKNVYFATDVGKDAVGLARLPNSVPNPGGANGNGNAAAAAGGEPPAPSALPGLPHPLTPSLIARHLTRLSILFGHSLGCSVRRRACRLHARRRRRCVPPVRGRAPVRALVLIPASHSLSLLLCLVLSDDAGCGSSWYPGRRWWCGRGGRRRSQGPLKGGQEGRQEGEGEGRAQERQEAAAGCRHWPPDVAPSIPHVLSPPHDPQTVSITSSVALSTLTYVALATRALCPLLVRRLAHTPAGSQQSGRCPSGHGLQPGGDGRSRS